MRTKNGQQQLDNSLTDYEDSLESFLRHFVELKCIGSA